MIKIKLLNKITKYERKFFTNCFSDYETDFKVPKILVAKLLVSIRLDVYSNETIVPVGAKLKYFYLIKKGMVNLLDSNYDNLYSI